MYGQSLRDEPKWGKKAIVLVRNEKQVGNTTFKKLSIWESVRPPQPFLFQRHGLSAYQVGMQALFSRD